ncbi:MAG: aldehyde dehydrogenase family protein, partial [Pyrinomonadaceae bacterium]|nr:aldehyde dehydrogenase family protein [Pyrinomonadaceae bacterium]
MSAAISTFHKTSANSINSDEIISYNPATNREIGRVEVANRETVFKVVERARIAAKLWRETTFAERARFIMKAREVILSEMDEIARLISDEMGKPQAEAVSTEIAPVLDLMQFFARNAKKMLKPEKINIGLFGLMARSSKIIYQPLGVVGIISPWNYPFAIPLGEVTMALMAGNSVVLKPSEITPFVGLRIAEIFAKVGLPQDVLQVISGDGKTGAALVESGVNKIMFTGSVATGKRIAESAAKTLTPVVLELGGKDPMIVLENANLENAANAAVWGAFANSGQTCASVERCYVHESIADKFIERVVELTEKLHQNIGCESCEIGAMSSESQLEIVENHVQDAIKNGAKVLTGGKRNANLNGGAFFEPTILTEINHDFKAMRE